MAACSTSLGQTNIQGFPLNGSFPSGAVIRSSGPSIAPQTHLGSGPIDVNNLSADILNCDVCRQRLGLPPLRSSPTLSSQTTSSPTTTQPTTTQSTLSTPKKFLAQPNAETVLPQTPDQPLVPMLGSPGLISSGTASQMAALGFVVEEFKPPQAQPDAIRLGDIPPEVRQQFMKGLELPPGASILSAEILGKSGESTSSEISVETIAAAHAAKESVSAITQTVASVPLSSEVNPSVENKVSGATEIRELEPLPAKESPAPMRAETEAIAKTELAQSQMAELSKKQAEFEQVVAERNAAIIKEQESLAKERKKMDAQLEQMQSKWQKRMELADATNKEALNMLEKRTAEVTELQMQLKAQKEATAKMSMEPKETRTDSNKPDGSKKPESATKSEK